MFIKSHHQQNGERLLYECEKQQHNNKLIVKKNGCMALLAFFVIFVEADLLTIPLKEN